MRINRVIILVWLVATMSRAATIAIPAGVYGSYTFTSGNTYVGAGVGKTIIRNASSAAFAHTIVLKNLNNISINGATLDGNGALIQDCTNITLTDVEITNARRTFGDHQALYFSNVNGLTLRRVRWFNCTQAIQAYGGQNVLAEDCTFDTVNYGWKWGMGGVKNVIVRRLKIVHDRQMGIEFQGGNAQTDNILIEDSAYVEPDLFADDSRNGNTMGFSVPMDGVGTRIIGRRNFVDGLAWILDSNGNRTSERRASRVGWLGVRDGIEVGGNSPSWTQNWIRNVNDPGAVTTSTAAQVSSNRVENCIETIDFGAPANGAAARVGSNISDNGPNVQLPQVGGWTLAGILSPGYTTQGNPTTNPAQPPTTNLSDYTALQQQLQQAQQRIAAKDAALTAAKSAAESGLSK